MKRRLPLLLVLCLTVGTARARSAGPGGAGASATPEVGPPSEEQALAGQREYRRRGGVCMNSQVYAPANREARVPEDVGHTPVLDPRVRGRYGKVLCCAVDGGTLWAADDQSLYQADGERGILLKRFGAADGLPDQPIQSIAPVGTQVWLATPAGLAQLDARTGRISTVPEIAFQVGRLASGPSGAWLVSDAGAYRLPPGEETWERLPEFPGQKRLASVVQTGFWWFQWRDKEIDPIGPAFATEEGFYVLHQGQLSRYDLAARQWQTIAKQAWHAVPHGRAVWIMCTDGLLRYSPAAGSTERFPYGEGPAEGRPVSMVVTDEALFLGSQANCDTKAARFSGFSGGGISQLDLATGEWTTTERIDGVTIHFVDALLADGEDVWAAAMLYEGALQRGAHPGMAHVKRWLPKPTGLALARYREGRWTILTRQGLTSEKRWIGPQGTGVHLDTIGPQHVPLLCSADGRVWGAYQMFPEHWYGGYYVSAGCLASESDGRWEARFDVQTEELNLLGEHPALLGVSRSHGGVWLAEGHLKILGLVQVGGRCWVVSQSGLYVDDPQTGRFTTVVQARDRLYFRATAAAAGRDAVWFGGDGGTVSRLDRKTGWLDVAGVVPGRQVTAVAIDDRDRVLVRTAKAEFTLPFSLRSAEELPVADVLVFDGQRWSPGAGQAVGQPLRPHGGRARCQGNYLHAAGERVAFLRGVFRPEVLCEDRLAGALWLATYSGAASVPLPPAAPAPTPELRSDE